MRSEEERLNIDNNWQGSLNGRAIVMVVMVVVYEKQNNIARENIN